MTLQNALNAPGAVLQQVSSIVTSRVSCTTPIPYDDTIPQISEGDQVLTVTITPKYANSVIVIQSNIIAMCVTSWSNNVCALFRNSDVNAIAANAISPGGAVGLNYCAPLFFSQTAGTTSAITYSIRTGPLNGSYSIVVNANGANRILGGVCASTLTATEYLT